MWLLAICVGAFLGTFIVLNMLGPADKSITRKMIGHDFLAFYTAGTFVRNGSPQSLFDLSATKQFQHSLGRELGLELGDSFGPWWNPPFYALVFSPLTSLHYPTALAVWQTVNLLCLLLAILVLVRMFLSPPRAAALSPERAYELRLCREDGPLTDWKTWLLVPLLIAMSSPAVQAINHGQNTCTSLLLLTLAVWAWRDGRPMLAGLVGGLLFYKPQLAAAFALVMVISLGWRAVAGLAITGAALLALTVIAMPGAIQNYLAALPANLRFMQVEHAYLWERHVTLKAFWRLLLQGRGPGEATLLTLALTLGGMLLLGGGLLYAMWRTRAARVDTPGGSDRTDSLIAATIATMPLLMPFYFDYDLLLLAVPGVLAARGIRIQLHRGGSEARPTPLDRWLLRIGVLMYLWMFANAGTGEATRVNLTVPLLFAVAAILIFRLYLAELVPAAVTSRTAAVSAPQVRRPLAA